MNFSQLAPWIAIAITLILSILVPLFTQIANNRFQLKLKRQEKQQYESNKKVKAYEDFLGAAGACIFADSVEALQNAGENMSTIYLYAPERLHPKIDNLRAEMNKYEWDAARVLLQEIAKELADDLNKCK